MLVPGVNLDRVVQKVLTALPSFQEILCTQVKGSITRHRVSQQQRPKIKVCRKVTQFGCERRLGEGHMNLWVGLRKSSRK